MIDIKAKRLIVPPTLMVLGVSTSGIDLSEFKPVHDAIESIGSLEHTMMCVLIAFLVSYIAAEVSNRVNCDSVTAIALSAIVTAKVLYTFMVVIFSLSASALLEYGIGIYIIYVALLIMIVAMAHRRMRLD